MKIPQLTIILTLFLGLLVVEGSGQSTFNIRWYYEAQTGAMNVWEIGDNYLVQGVYFDSLVPPQKHGFVSVRNLDGDEEYSLSFGSSSEQFNYHSGRNVSYGDTTVVLLPCEVNDTLHAALIWINPQGEVFREKFIPSPYASLEGESQSSWLSLGDILIDNAGNITLVVNISNDVQGGSICLNRLNFDGEFLWQTNFDYPNWQDVSLALWQMNGVIIGTGLRYDVSDSQSFLYEVDENGSVSELGELQTDESYVFDIVADENGITAASRIFDPLWGYKGYIFQADLNGELNWDLEFDDDWGLGQGFRRIKATSDGNYVALGNYRVLGPEDPEIDGEDNWFAWLVKFTPDGNVLWQRKYANVTSTEDYHITSDFKLTSDGGYILSGMVEDNSDSPDAMSPAQQAWLVKVDEHGCLVPGCHVSIEDQPEVSYFAIGPNPVTECLNVFIQDYGLSISAQLQIHDLQGKLIETSSVQPNVTYLLDVSNYPQGAYTVTLLDHDVKYSEVVLVE